MATRQLRKLNITWEQVRDRRNPGWLRRVHQGVYALAGTETAQLTRWMAAVLACGPDAVLSHADAAVLWDLAGRDTARDAGQTIHVTIPAETNRRQRPGISLHRVDLPSDDVSVRRSVPVTTASRTILDLAGSLDDRRLERIVDEAERLRLCRHSELLSASVGKRGGLGSARLRKVLRRHTLGSTATRSELEERFLALCRQAGLPQPLVNVELLGLTVDFLWPPALVAELDGMGSHLTRRAFHRPSSPSGFDGRGGRDRAYRASKERRASASS